MQDKFDYLNGLIEKLSGRPENTLLIFMLKAQLVEYGLKTLFAAHPTLPSRVPSDFLETSTLGMVISKMETENDFILADLIKLSKEFNSTRRHIIHHFLTSPKSIYELESDMNKQIEHSIEIENEIFHALDFLDEQHYSWSDFQNRMLLGMMY